MFVYSYGMVVEVGEKNAGDTYSTRYVYNPRDELTRITDHQGNVFSFTFDSLGRKTLLDDPDLGVWSYAYDAVGNLVSQTDGRGVIVNFNYDELNRVLVIDYPADADVSYLYDTPKKNTLSGVSSGFGFLFL